MNIQEQLREWPDIGRQARSSVKETFWNYVQSRTIALPAMHGVWALVQNQIIPTRNAIAIKLYHDT